MLQWGQRLSALDTYQGEEMTLADLFRLQWGQRLSALDTALAGEEIDAQSPASMGPTPFSVGYHGRLTWTWRCFNGANAFQRWIHVVPNRNSANPDWLQWGQRLSALDTDRRGDICPAYDVASMGPTPFSVGYNFMDFVYFLLGYASMGPTPFSVGYVAWAVGRGDGSSRASMGPTPFSVGYSLFAALFAYYTAFRRRMSSFCARIFLLATESSRFSPVRADF